VDQVELRGSVADGGVRLERCDHRPHEATRLHSRDWRRARENLGRTCRIGIQFNRCPMGIDPKKQKDPGDTSLVQRAMRVLPWSQAPLVAMDDSACNRLPLLDRYGQYYLRIFTYDYPPPMSPRLRRVTRPTRYKRST
jgi:hypothetical protein